MHGRGTMRRKALFLFILSSLSLLVVALPQIGAGQQGQQQGQGQQQQDQPLPGRGVVIDIDAPGRALFKIAVPNVRGPQAMGAPAAEVMRNDFKLVSLFRVLEPRSFIANLDQEGLNIVQNAWTSVGAQGVIKGEIRQNGNQIAVEMRLYELAHGTTPTLTRTYNGSSSQLRAFMHQFANAVVEKLTGQAAAFGTRLTFARRVGPGRKDVYVGDFDGHGVGRVSSGRGIAMLPNFGPGGIWCSVLSARGMFITKSGTSERPLIAGAGLNMGVAICGGRVYFTSTRDGNSEIYSASTNGSGVRRLTRNPAIDVSPTCGPGGQIAFVSDRHGGPQIFVMSSDGGGARRVTFRGTHNQTPAFCPDPQTPLLAFTGRDAGMDIFTVNLRTQAYTRLTQGQGSNKDPAFSPDCRMVAFASSRGGIFISNPEGLNQNLVIRGAAETIRWSR